MSNIAFIGEPPARRIVSREFYGLNNALYRINLECGHYWAGLTQDMPAGDTYPCRQCTIVHLPNNHRRPQTRPQPEAQRQPRLFA